MVSRPAPDALAARAAAERPRISVAGDGTLAAIVDDGRAVVVELPSGTPFTEVDLDPAASQAEVAWIGAPPRLLVVSRFEAHSTAHLIDPHGPRAIAEIRLETPMQLVATVGAHALALDASGVAVLAASETRLLPYRFPARVAPTAAGAAGGNFVAALSGVIEEWDPHARVPRRRLRLPRPTTITAVGGSDRAVWMTTPHEPSRVDVIPLVNRGQPKHHDLPEPIAHVSGHPRSDLIACVGADTGRVYILDLDGRAPLRVLGLERADAAALFVGRTTGVIATTRGGPIEVVSVDGSTVEDGAAPSPRALFGAAAPAAATPSTAVADDPPEMVEPAVEEPPPFAAATESVALPFASTLSSPPAALDVAFAARRAVRPEVRTWRDDAAAWARAVAAGTVRGAPPAPPIEALASWLEVPGELVPALVLLYGAHLAGEPGAAPVDVARVLGGRWSEALGTGDLAAMRLVRHGGSRVRLAASVQAALDELPPTTGVVVGTPGPIVLLGPCVVVAPAGPLDAIAAGYVAAVGGAILAARDDAPVADLVEEARARGAVPMRRLSPEPPLDLGRDPCVLVVGDEAAADALGVPRLG